ncbi:hypothetical protein BJ742DRAFT_870420 [Cladochytrium replicatum]|nr:hypothetical protein BJ742DRAFT_870420 [Cladochytrium replicatum]
MRWRMRQPPGRLGRRRTARAEIRAVRKGKVLVVVDDDAAATGAGKRADADGRIHSAELDEKHTNLERKQPARAAQYCGDDTQQTGSTWTTTTPTEDAASSAASEPPVAEGGEAPEPEEKKPVKNPTRINSTSVNVQCRRSTKPTQGKQGKSMIASVYDNIYFTKKRLLKKIPKHRSQVEMDKEEDKGNNMLQSEGHGGEEVYYKSVELRKAITIIERMANQDTFDDIAEDYKYWEDASGVLREGKTGTLLPLWKFVYEKEKHKQDTAICCSPKFRDLFAIGCGSYDFSKQGPGMIACFTLKNPSYPEFLYVTESGVMCLDIHPQHPSMIAVGLFDGSICWQKEDDLDENMNFSSVSSDGRVTHWTLVKKELVYTDVIKLEHQLASLASAKPAPADSNLSPEGSANAPTQRLILKDVAWAPYSSAYPCVNVPGYLHFTREFSDGNDLNRVFPGTECGTAKSISISSWRNKLLPTASSRE